MGCSLPTSRRSGHIQRSDHNRQHIVEIMRNAAGELADRFHLLHLTQLRLDLGSFGHLGLKRGSALGHAILELVVQRLQLGLGPELPGMGDEHPVRQANDNRGGEGIEPHGKPTRGPLEYKRADRIDQVQFGQNGRQYRRQ